MTIWGRRDSRSLRFPRLWLLILFSGLLFAQKADPQLAARLNEEGLKLLEQGQTDGAAKRFREALQADPDHVEALSNNAQAA